MATPAYTKFDSAKPDNLSQGLTALVASIRANQAAIRDAILHGVPTGYNVTSSGGSKPATLTATKGAEKHRATLTWGVSGGQANKVTQIVWAWSNDNGVTWVTVSTDTVSWDSSGYFVSYNSVEA